METELLQLNGLYRSTCKPTILSPNLFALLCRDFFQYMVQTGQIIVGDDWRINGSLCCSSGKLISREKRSHLWIIWSCHRKSRTIRLFLEQRLVRFCCSDEQREILFDIPDVLLSIVGNPPRPMLHIEEWEGSGEGVVILPLLINKPCSIPTGPFTLSCRKKITNRVNSYTFNRVFNTINVLQTLWI